MKTLLAFLLIATPALATGYSVADAAFVTSSRDPDVLNYVVCLATSDEAKCQGLAAKLHNADEPTAEDIRLMIMECGFRPGEASPDMGCDE